MKTKILIASLLIMGFVIIAITSCKKDEIILKKDPVITWINPSDIYFGTLLDSLQLNATADIAGTFIYTPPIGTILNVGTNQDLNVDFTPTDVTVYNSVSKTVKINVIALPEDQAIDIDGNIYHTVTIGTQTWMIENLKTTKFNDGEVIPLVSDNIVWASLITPGNCTYKNTANTDTINTYGRLYNWYAVNTGKLAPTGWHVPTDDEWSKLENYLIANGFNYDGTITGDRDSNNKIAKALASTTNWTSDIGQGTVGNTDYIAIRNATNFSALPAGYRFIDGTFYRIGVNGVWWSSSELYTLNGLYRFMRYNYSNVDRDYIIKCSGFSIRCVKDN